MSKSVINEYAHDNGVDTASAEEGTELDKVLSKDEAWSLVTGKSRSEEAASASEEDSGETEDPGGNEPAEEAVDPSLSREKLNEIATAKGVEDPESLPNKGKVIEAIEAASASEED